MTNAGNKQARMLREQKTGSKIKAEASDIQRRTWGNYKKQVKIKWQTKRIIIFQQCNLMQSDSGVKA